MNHKDQTSGDHLGDGKRFHRGFTGQGFDRFSKAGIDKNRKKGSKFIKGVIAQQKKQHPG